MAKKTDLKDPKFWTPILALLALVGSYSTGTGLPDPEAVEAATEGVTELAANAEQLYGAAGAVLAGIAGWFGLKGRLWGRE